MIMKVNISFINHRYCKEKFFSNVILFSSFVQPTVFLHSVSCISVLLLVLGWNSMRPKNFPSTKMVGKYWYELV
jgi:hypothetical protein